MRIEYDADVDVLTIYLREGKYASSDEVAPNMIVDFDPQGAPLTIEILQAREMLGFEGALRLDIPFAVVQT